MKKTFGSLSKPVLITIAGESGSGKAMIASIISNTLVELGVKVTIKIESSKNNEKQAINTINIIRKKKLDNSLHLADKEVTIEIPMVGENE